MSRIRFRLKKWRLHFGYSQGEVAGQLGVTQPAVARQERSGRLTIENATAYARLYRITLDQLLSGPPAPAPWRGGR